MTEKEIEVLEINQENVKSEKLKKVLEVLNDNGIGADVINARNGGEFSEIVMLRKQELPTKKMIRLFRGVNHMDESLLDQVPYAMRSIKSKTEMTKLDSLRQEVNNLAKNPTYENLLAYVEKARPLLSESESQRIDDELTAIENGVLNGHTLRKELIYNQAGHNGGVLDFGIAPYVSATTDPYEAAGYGHEGLMVIDLPLSETESFDAEGKELCIKGTLDNKFISSIVIRNKDVDKDKQQVNQELFESLGEVYRASNSSIYNQEELPAEIQKKINEEKQSDDIQWEKDVEIIRQDRVKKLAKLFPEAEIDLKDLKEKSIKSESDVYTEAKRKIFDFYKTLVEKFDKRGRKVEDYEYSEFDGAKIKKFDRENIDEIMLIKLREMTQILERRNK